MQRFEEVRPLEYLFGVNFNFIFYLNIKIKNCTLFRCPRNSISSEANIEWNKFVGFFSIAEIVKTNVFKILFLFIRINP